MQITAVPEQSVVEPRLIASEGRRPVSRYRKALVILFLLSLPVLDGQVDGDGLGYYAYLRPPLIDHNLAFATDWPDPNILLRFPSNPVRTAGHPPNFYAIGSAMLWAPFVITAHV